jgi:hypothetical protein
MATLEHLVATSRLLQHAPDLEDGEQFERVLYLTPEFDVWLGKTLSALGHMHGRNRTPYEQAEQILYEYVVGRRLAYGTGFHPLDPLASHVWELKTPDLRLFGWFARRSHLILVCAELKDHLSRSAAYAPYVARVVAYRNALELDEPKAVVGVRYDEVL